MLLICIDIKFSFERGRDELSKNWHLRCHWLASGSFWWFFERITRWNREKKIYLFACFLLFLRFGIVPIEGFGGLLRLFLRGPCCPSYTRMGACGWLSLYPVAVVGVGIRCDKQIWVVRY